MVSGDGARGWIALLAEDADGVEPISVAIFWVPGDVPSGRLFHARPPQTLEVADRD
jgi:hypothetical protein